MMVESVGPDGGHSGHAYVGEGDVQLAQSTSAGPLGDPIGAVKEANGQVLLIHADGSTETGAAGIPVFLNDDVVTKGGSAVEIIFTDGTTFSLGANADMKLDKMIYDPGGSDNALDVTIVKGAFVFITGKIGPAQGEGVAIDTPAGTIGIRGTSGAGTFDEQTGSWVFTLFRDPNGVLSRFNVSTPGGTVLLDQELESTQVAGPLAPPSQTFALTPQQAGALFGDALHLLQQQFPTLQQRGELEHNVNPAAGPPE